MKKFDLPLYTDTLFAFAVSSLFFLCVFRFGLPFWAALAAAVPAGAAAAFLLWLWMRKQHAGRSERERDARAAADLARALALRTPRQNATLIADSLNALRAAEKRRTDEREGDGAQSADAGKASPSSPADGKENATPPARAAGGRVLADGRALYPLFRFEKLTADDLCPLLREGETPKTVYAGGYTEGAAGLAAACGVELKGAEEVYRLVKEAGKLNEVPALPAAARRSGWHRLLRRESWKGYLTAGVGLLVFSLLSVFPLYYVIAGALLLTAAAAVRLFGKR